MYIPTHHRERTIVEAGPPVLVSASDREAIHHWAFRFPSSATYFAFPFHSDNSFTEILYLGIIKPSIL